MKLGEKDKLIIKNGGSSSSKILATLDSNSKANDLILITTVNSAYIYLDSKSEMTNSGFQIKYKIGKKRRRWAQLHNDRIKTVFFHKKY